MMMNLKNFVKISLTIDFFQLIISLPSCIARQRALSIFSDCTRSDFFPSEQYSSDMEFLSYVYSLLDSPSSDEVSASLQILSQVMLSCPAVCQFLVEEQKLHSKLEYIQATPYLAKTLAVLCDVHPESLELTLKLIPYCLQTNDKDTLLYSLLAMKSAIKSVPESSPVIINLIDQYSKNLFSFDIDNIEESGPYPDTFIITNPDDQTSTENTEENFQLLLEIISLIPDVPPTFLPQMIHTLWKCKRDDTILLWNFAVRQQKNSWRGDQMIDDLICWILLRMMENCTFELQKSCFHTIMYYYQWENELNPELITYLIRYIEDKDLQSVCLFILCDIIEVFIVKKSGKESDDDLESLHKLLETAIPSVEKIVVDSDESDDDSALAQKFLDLLREKENH